MAKSAANWVWQNSRASNGSLLVLMAIAFETEDKGNCIMTVAELAGKARLSERAVQAATADLTGLGELTVTRRAEGHRNGYSLRMTGGADIAPLPVSSPADSAPPQILHPADSAPLEQESAGQTRGAESAPLEISDMFVSSTGRSVAEVKDVPAKPPRRRSDDREDVTRLCEHLASRIEANGARRPNVTQKWRDAARLMLDADKRTEEQAHRAIDWCQDHEFWRSNILSMPKLREKYDQLKMQAMRGRASSAPKTTTNDRVQQAIEAGKRVQAMLDGGS